ncbi:MAG: MFS transporter [Rikenellaceae bacterium]
MATSTHSVSLWTRDYTLTFISNLLLFFSFYQLLPVLPFYVMNHLGADESIAGLVLSCYTLAALLIRPFSGYLVDMFARKPLYLLCYGIFVSIFAGYIIGGTLFIFVTLRILHGLSFGITTVSGSTLAIDVMPSERRAEGIGYYGMAANMAMAIGPMVGLMLYDTTSYNVVFAVSLASGLLGLAIITTIHAPKKVTAPIGNDGKPHHEVLSLDRFILVKGILLSLVFVMFGIGYGVIANYIGIYSKGIGIGNGAGLFFTVEAIGILVSRILSAKLLNEGKIEKLVYRGIFMLLLAYLLIIVFNNTTVYYICALLWGLGFGFLAPTFQTMFVNLAEHNRRGTANSTYFTSWDIGIGFGIAVGGYFIEMFGFRVLFGFCSMAVVVALIVYYKFAAAHYAIHKLR